MSDDDKKLYPNLYADGPVPESGPYPNLDLRLDVDLDRDAATLPLAPAPSAPPLGHEPEPPLVHASKPGPAYRTICGLRPMDGADYAVHRTEIGKVTCPECKKRLR